MVILTLLVLVVSTPLFFMLDPDFGWHLALGRYMHEHHSLVHNLTGYGSFGSIPQVDHEWLSHWLLYPVYQQFGYGAFILLSILALWTTVWLLYREMKRVKAGTTAIVFVTVMFLSSASIVYGVRLQLLLLVGAALLAYIARSTWSVKKRYLLYFLIFLIGGNLHGGFIVLLLIPVILEFPWRTVHKPTPMQYGLLLVLLTCAVAINPYGKDFWKLTIDYMMDSYYKQNISEWRRLISYPLLGENGFMPLIATIFLVTVAGNWRRIKPQEGLLLAVFWYLGTSHVRFLPLAVLLSAPVLARSFEVISTEIKERIEYRNRYLGLAFLGLWLLTAVMIVPGYKHKPVLAIDPRLAMAYPHKAAEVMKQQPACTSRTVFNPYEWGGYLQGYYPEIPVFMDGRAPQQKLASGHTLLQEFDSFYTGNNQDTVEQFRRYGFECALLNKRVSSPHPSQLEMKLFGITEATWQNYLVIQHQVDTYLASAPDWKRAYEDEDALIYIKQ